VSERPADGPTDAERWDARYAEGDAPREPSSFVTAQAGRLPGSGTALDLAGGAGRHAIWLAQQGLDVTLLDVSEVALRIAGRWAGDAGVVLRLLRRDVITGRLPNGPFDVVLVHGFLHHDVLDRVPTVLAPGGLFLYSQATTTNLERHDRPPARFCVEPGEMARIADRLRLEVVELGEHWTPEGTHRAELVARRPVPAPIEA
jgi:tellurite methyltransferase